MMNIHKDLGHEKCRLNSRQQRLVRSDWALEMPHKILAPEKPL